MIDRLSYLNTNDELPEAIDNSLFSHIEDELSININDIINSDNMLLYDRYFFKCNVNSIEIFYPSIPINGEFPFRSPDSRT